MTKTILATVLTAAFLLAMPAHAEDKAPAPAGEKGQQEKQEKQEKKQKKDKKADDSPKDPKPAGW
jgi:hypothetical protein